MAVYDRAIPRSHGPFRNRTVRPVRLCSFREYIGVAPSSLLIRVSIAPETPRIGAAPGSGHTAGHRMPLKISSSGLCRTAWRRRGRASPVHQGSDTD